MDDPTPPGRRRPGWPSADARSAIPVRLPTASRARRRRLASATARARPRLRWCDGARVRRSGRRPRGRLRAEPARQAPMADLAAARRAHAGPCRHRHAGRPGGSTAGLTAGAVRSRASSRCARRHARDAWALAVAAGAGRRARPPAPAQRILAGRRSDTQRRPHPRVPRRRTADFALRYPRAVGDSAESTPGELDPIRRRRRARAPASKLQHRHRVVGRHDGHPRSRRCTTLANEVTETTARGLPRHARSSRRSEIQLLARRVGLHAASSARSRRRTPISVRTDGRHRRPHGRLVRVTVIVREPRHAPTERELHEFLASMARHRSPTERTSDRTFDQPVIGASVTRAVACGRSGTDRAGAPCGAPQLVLERCEPFECEREPVLEVQDLAHAGEAHAFVGELLDPAQQRDVVVRVPAAPALGALPARSGPCARRCAASARAPPRARRPPR